MIPRHLLHSDDFEWFLDNGRRRFRVIPLDLDGEGRVRRLRIVPVTGAKPTVVMARCHLSPGDWDDTDRYASARLNAISMSGAARAGVVRPEPNAVRLGHDFGRWCAETFQGERLAQRISCESQADACAEVARLAAKGLQRLPDAPSVLLYGREG